MLHSCEKSFPPFWPPRSNPPVEGPLQCDRPPHRRGLHLQLGSGRCPLPHDAARPPPPHSPGTSAPARLCWRPLSPHGGSQVAPAALVTDTDGHRGGPAGTKGGGGQEAQRGGEGEGEKEGGEEEREGTEDWGGERGAEEAVSGVAEWMGRRLMGFFLLLFILIYFSCLLMKAMLSMPTPSHWPPALRLNAIQGSEPAP